MPQRVRKAALTTHITVSVGWVGAVVAYLALDVTTVVSRDAQSSRAAYLAMEVIAWNVIVPLALATLLTGLVMGLGTRWGLCRHYWVAISLVLTVFAVGVLLVETQTISRLATVAADPTTSDTELRALPSTLLHSGLGLVVLLVVLVLNVYKPQGLTPYGWRKLQEQRTESQLSRGVNEVAFIVTLVVLLVGSLLLFGAGLSGGGAHDASGHEPGMLTGFALLAVRHRDSRRKPTSSVVGVVTALCALYTETTHQGRHGGR